MISLKDIESSRERISPFIHKTPISFSQTFSDMTRKEVFLKFENLQKTGAFKIRGAINYISQLKKIKGVITASAGNHAQGVAYASKIFGISSTIVMPENTPLIKILSTKNYGAKIILHGKVYDDAFYYAKELAKEENLEFVPAFDDEKIIAGQGTIGLEILEDLKEIEALIVPIGGGGLASGILIALKETNPKIKVYGVQSNAFPYMYEKIKKVEIPQKPEQTIAEGIAVKKPGEITSSIIETYIDDIFVVEEEKIAEAVLLLLERAKTLVEGAGASTLAALLKYYTEIPEEKIVLILSGGNIDVSLLTKIIEFGLMEAGRIVHMKVKLPDLPGHLSEVIDVISKEKANIITIHQDPSLPFFPKIESNVEFTLETKNPDQIRRIFDKIKEKGYEIEILEKGGIVK
ncbi:MULTISPECIES: threonine ammonia-lyase [Dictyoglomus]|uniref:Threonine dehydratase n=1 Tax=Dictyoglomus turgidum (strain DSM 6724 / Z-1310) TaxID=515635 RepID=B8E131_DICTD|nr:MULTISPECIES: threonine ammonia-lyase [Dictyoglomus]ACK42768.1 threonine dehydratase [Dictyoglomus turgidum DSM 6724]HBU30827.1 threonine ammonia-lyase [Dictyoglomus sp.]